MKAEYRVSVTVDKLTERNIEKARDFLGVDKDTEFFVESTGNWSSINSNSVMTYTASVSRGVKVTFIWTVDDDRVDTNEKG